MTCPSPAPGYSEAIAPLIAERCMPCHAPGGVSGHLLQTYPEVYGLRQEAFFQVSECLMPPAGATPLSADERTALLTWFVCKAPDN
jgi:hypothetical protein